MAAEICCLSSFFLFIRKKYSIGLIVTEVAAFPIHSLGAPSYATREKKCPTQGVPARSVRSSCRARSSLCIRRQLGPESGSGTYRRESLPGSPSPRLVDAGRPAGESWLQATPDLPWQPVFGRVESPQDEASEPQVMHSRHPPRNIQACPQQ